MKTKHHVASSSLQTTINDPQDIIWEKLTYDLVKHLPFYQRIQGLAARQVFSLWKENQWESVCG